MGRKELVFQEVQNEPVRLEISLPLPLSSGTRLIFHNRFYSLRNPFRLLDTSIGKNRVFLIEYFHLTRNNFFIRLLLLDYMTLIC